VPPSVASLDLDAWPEKRKAAASVALTVLLTRPGATGETCWQAGEHHRSRALVRQPQRDAGDAEDARRTAHNPAIADSQVPGPFPLGLRHRSASVARTLS